MDFDSFHDDIMKDTYSLIDDIKAGRDLDLGKLKFFSNDQFFSSAFDFGSRRRRRETNRDFTNKYSSFPSFSSFKKSTSETDYDPETSKFKSTRVKRSESTYSTSSYDTTDSNDTLSEMSDSSFSPSNTSTRPKTTTNSSNHNRNSSSDSSTTKGDLTKKLEEEFLKDERHSMPHEFYSKCDRYLNDLDRPRSVPPSHLNPNLASRDIDSDVKHFPSKTMDSRDLRSFLSQKSNISNGYCSPGSCSKSTVTGSVSGSTGSKFSSLNSFDFPSMPDGGSDFEGDIRSPTVPNVSQKHSFSRSEPNVPTFNVSEENPPSWKERQGRIEDALRWLRSELGNLRTQDKVLISQLNRCQDTIEAIKKQRTHFDENEEYDEEEEGHWEDWEIAEFDRRCQENKEYEDENANPSSKSSQSTTGISGAKKNMNKNGGIRQDVQAVL